MIEKLPEPIEEVIFTNEEIVRAYHELTNMKGVEEKHKPFIQSVYQYLFKESFDWNCNSCVSSQARKFHNFLIKELNVKL